jgi:hypothetical protein
MPYYRFELNVPLSPVEVAERIRAITDKPRSFWESLGNWSPGRGSPQRFVGRVRQLSFQLQRDIGYRNSLLPIISGLISPAPQGSTIQVKMYLHLFAAAFVAFWLSATGGLMLISLFDGAGSNSAWVGRPAEMFALGLGMTLLGFFPEAFRAKHLLEEALRR